ncbi:DUF4177 domain-containing protein [Rhodovulum adriaticum]|uniref:DUF4177 domain-containing protein n=1 Tax=Rhodovulum adriaticum TaxID=35804 RepID=A0A4R2NVW6_RHOAD|nr:DUF4177 domain-containing protein [Rhodovulum adriaticum]TCP26279.1 hypothetical protein EV656_102242 [Rhodovulum adriaticum]
MTQYEYKVVPAPTRGQRAPGVKGTADRFAHALTVLMNQMAADGWEYLRADTLPCEERQGLRSRTTVYQNLLVFRRAHVVHDTDAETPAPARPDPEQMARTAALSLHPEVPEGEAPELGPARAPDIPPPPERPLGPAEGEEPR